MAPSVKMPANMSAMLVPKGVPVTSVIPPNKPL
jgi:hypothetical protein